MSKFLRGTFKEQIDCKYSTKQKQFHSHLRHLLIQDNDTVFTLCIKKNWKVNQSWYNIYISCIWIFLCLVCLFAKWAIFSLVCFKVYDLNGSGYITREAVQHMLKDCMVKVNTGLDCWLIGYLLSFSSLPIKRNKNLHFIWFRLQPHQLTLILS